jgi:hypothetical protein
VLEEREVFRGADQRTQPQVSFTSHATKRRQHPLGERWIVDRGRIGGAHANFHRRRGARGVRVIRRDRANAGVDALTHFLVERADGAFELHGLGHDVRAVAAGETADGDHRRRFGDVHGAADDRLQSHHDLRANHDRIDAAPRHGAVRLPALDLDQNESALAIIGPER